MDKNCGYCTVEYYSAMKYNKTCESKIIIVRKEVRGKNVLYFIYIKQKLIFSVSFVESTLVVAWGQKSVS